MSTAKLFMNGRSQAVRLPRDFRFEGEEVLIKKIGEMVMLVPKGKWEEVFLDAIKYFPDDVEFDRDRREAERDVEL